MPFGRRLNIIFELEKFPGTAHAEKIRRAATPKDAKKLAWTGQSRLRPGWDDLRDDVMRRAIRRKFEAHPDLRELLLSTGDEELIESAPNDYYWGCGADGSGKNMTGVILMKFVRNCEMPLRQRRGRTSGCTGARASSLVGFIQWFRAGPVNLVFGACPVIIMGILIVFYAGDPKRIVDAFCNGSSIPIWQAPFVLAASDFSLHLSPEWLDILFRVAYEMAGWRLISADPHCEHLSPDDNEPRAASLLSEEVVSALAELPDDQIANLAQQWLAALDREEADGFDLIEPTPDMVLSLRALVHVCRVAQFNNTAVVMTGACEMLGGVIIALPDDAPN